MKKEKQYTILDSHGEAVGSIWAHEARPKPEATDGTMFLYRHKTVIASAWYGCKPAEKEHPQ